MMKSSNLTSTITIGIVMGIVELLTLISFATLIFSGELDVFVGRGIGLFLLTGIVVMATTALRSTIRGGSPQVQDVSSVILAVIAANIAQGVSNPQDETTYYTVLAAFAINAILVGLTFFAISKFGLSNIIRALPYPVIGGLIAGSGWLLFSGGLAILTDSAELSEYFDSMMILRWTSGLVFGVVLFIALERINHFLVMPSILLIGIVLFYIALFLTGTSLDEARQTGFLLGPFPETSNSSLIQPLTPDKLGDVDWEAIFMQNGHTIAIVAVSSITLVLNISGLELILREDIDLDTELEAAGTMNLLTGLFGGAIGFQSLSRTTISSNMGATNTHHNLISVGVAGSVLFIGTDLLAFFPKTVLGGLLIFLGLGFLWQWLVMSYRELPRVEYAMIVTIVVSVAIIGFLEGVFIGILFAVIAFAYSYSQIEFIRHHFTGYELTSSVQRSPSEREYLQHVSNKIHIFQLQGYIFFGTANALYSRIAEDVESVHYLILDYRQVVQIDSSTIYSLQKLAQLCEKNDILLIFSSVGKDLKQQTKQINALLFEQLDLAIAYAEDQFIKGRPTAALAEAVTNETLATMFRQRDLIDLFEFMQERHLAQGEVLTEQGSKSNELYFVVRGLLGVYLKMENSPDFRIRSINEGAVVGEVSAYLDTARTASIIAEKDSIILELSKDALVQIADDNPKLAIHFHEQMAQILAQRLIDTNRALQAALE